MKDKPRVSLGELLTLERRPVVVIPDGQYAEIGVYSFGRGIFHKPPRSGLEVGDKPLFLIREGDFILQVTFAWEGAVAQASSAENGMFGSVRFLTFRVDETRCYPPYLVNYFRTAEGLEQLVRICPGSAGRNRVLSVKRIPEVRVPLPPLGEQRRIVSHINELTSKIEEACNLRRQSTDSVEAIRISLIRSVFSALGNYEMRSLRDVVVIANGQGLKSSDRNQSGKYAVYGSGGQVGRHTQALSANPFVVIGRKGSAGKPTFAAEGGWATDTTYYAFPRNRNELDCRFLFYALSSMDFSGDIIVTAIPGINRTAIYAHKIPLPPITEQGRIAAYLDGLQARVDALKRLQTETAAELEALFPSILSRAFKGEL